MSSPRVLGAREAKRDLAVPRGHNPGAVPPGNIPRDRAGRFYLCSPDPPRRGVSRQSLSGIAQLAVDLVRLREHGSVLLPLAAPLAGKSCKIQQRFQLTTMGFSW